MTKLFRGSVICITLLSASLLSAEEYALTEKSIVELAKDSPQSQSIGASLEAADFNRLRANDAYDFTLNANGRVFKSDETQVVGSFPPVSSSKVFNIDITRPTKYGFSVGVGHEAEFSRIKSFGDLKKRTYFAELSIDLFKDFLGRNSKSHIKDAKLGYEVAQIENKINMKKQRLNFRKIFWSYVAAKESKDFASQLLDSSKRQLRTTRKKYKNDVADSSDIARFKSQLNEREAQMNGFIRAMKRTELGIRELLPQLSNKEFVLGNYNSEETLKKFYSCLGLIEKEKDTPLRYTLIDDLVKLKEKQLAARTKTISTYSDIDIKLQGQIGLVGAGNKIDQADRNLKDQKNNFSTIGLNISMPLGGKKRVTEKKQLSLEKMNFEAEARTLQARMNALHITFLQNIELVNSIVKSRSNNSNDLKKVLNNARKKYGQARISSFQLLQEEDRYLSNAIQLINAKRDMIHLLFDYLSVFSEFSCPMSEV